ncbi:MAG: hypothetical protein ACJ72O_07490 [Marmoricola sp.]
MALTRTLAALGAAALVSTALVGCGSSGSDTLTKAEFQTKANKLCADANKDTESYGADITEKSSDADVTAAIDKTVKRNQDLIAAIDALDEPKSISDDVASMLSSVRAGMKDLGKVSSVQDLVAFDPNGANFKAANDKAKALGLDTCAS